MQLQKSTGFRKEAGACRQCAKRSTSQQLKVVPLGDQQPFFLQLGKLHRHGGTLHAEKIRQLLTVKGDVKGKGGLPDGFGGQVGQQLFPGGPLADMGDLIVKKQYFVCQNADQIADEFLVMVAGGGAGGEQPLDVQQQDFAILLCTTLMLRMAPGVAA